MLARVPVLALLTVLLGCVPARVPVPSSSPVPAVPGAGMTAPGPAELSAWLADPNRPLPAGDEAQRPLLLSVYRARNFEPIWLAASALQVQLIQALDRCTEQGIDPRALGLDRLRRVESDPGTPPAAKEILLSQTFLSYAAMLQAGRVDIAGIESDWALPRPAANPAEALARASASNDIGALVDGLAPSSADYRSLQDALVAYRRMQAAGAWPSLPPGTKLDMGDRGPMVALLRERLAAEGYLPPGGQAADSFDPALQLALNQFQARHGLSVDGKLGAATLAALDVGAGERVKQIEINLERARTVMHVWPATRIVVNTAASTLAFYKDGRLALDSLVINGDPRHPTPALAATVGAVVFNPPWNVPVSIVRNEIQPRLARDPGYLSRNHMQIIGRSGGDPYGRDIDWRHTSVLAQGWQLRQLPGPSNSLGTVLLEMPNSFDVYMHDTPAKSLFSQPNRALSHGCVRVQQIRPLAAALLGAAWPGDAVDQAVVGGATLRIPLANPVPVYLIYATAFVDKDGAAEFRDDVYGRDARLAAALARLEAGAGGYSAELGAPPKACPPSRDEG